MFGFPTAEYTVFNRNFLRKVIVTIDYKKTSSFIDDEALIKSTFSEKFPRIVKAQGNGLQITFGKEEPKFETLKENEVFVLKSQDGQTTLELNDKKLKLSFDGASYKSFNDIREVLSLVEGLFDGLLEEVNKISLKKINIIEFENSTNPNGILYFLLNKSIVGNVDSFPNTELITHNLQSVNYKNENYLLNIRYGMNIPPIENLKIGQVVIDIEAAKHTSTKISEMSNEFDNLSSEIFNVFNSLINDNAKRILNGT